MDHKTIAHVQALGFEVWMRNPHKDTWMLYTDGTNIGYMEAGNLRPFRICTVHKPNKQTGTGFVMLELFELPTKEQLELGFRNGSQWGADWASVQKYKNMEEYRQRDSFNARYARVEPVNLER